MQATTTGTWGSMERRHGSIAEARELLAALCTAHATVAVTGRCGIGKTYVTQGLGFTSTDTLIKGRSWEAQRDAVLDAARRATWLLEGVTVARALRHGLRPQALLWLRGTPLRPQMTVAGMRLGDQIDKWVREFLASPYSIGCRVVEWQIKERKYA